MHTLRYCPSKTGPDFSVASWRPYHAAFRRPFMVGSQGIVCWSRGFGKLGILVLFRLKGLSRALPITLKRDSEKGTAQSRFSEGSGAERCLALKSRVWP